MTDILPLVNELLRQHGDGVISSRRRSVETLNGFLREAYAINARIAELNAYLRSIRQSYLSVAQPSRRKQLGPNQSPSSVHKQEQDRKYFTNAQRDEIDAEAKKLLRELNATINNLSEAEKIRQSAESSVALSKRARNGLGTLGRWAAGGSAVAKSPEEELQEAKANVIRGHRESVIWYLQRKLEECGRVQSSMMEIRIRREVEKNKSVLYRSRGFADIPDGSSLVAHDSGFAQAGGYRGGQGLRAEEMDKHGTEAPLSEEQMQMFASENQDMLKHYEGTLDQVRNVERSLIEISDLQTTLSNNLTIQSAQISQLVQDSDFTTENLGKGNKELKQASERRSVARMAFWATVCYCVFLIIWDLIF